MRGGSMGERGRLAAVLACALAVVGCDAQPSAPPGGFDTATPDTLTDTSAGDATSGDTSTSDTAAPSDTATPSDTTTDTASPSDTATPTDTTADTTPAPIAPGRVVWRRLNRTEYRNTLRDLTGTSRDPGKDLPSDDLGYGFDNVASVLTMSPLHLELYERAARIVAEEITTPPIDNALVFVTEGESLTVVGGYGAPSDTAFLLWSQGELSSRFVLPRAGRWTVVVRGREDQAGTEHAKLLVSIDGRPIQTLDLTPTMTTATLEVELEAGQHSMQVEFINDYYDDTVSPASDRNAWVDFFGVTGPTVLDVYADTMWAKNIACRPEALDRACLDAALAKLAGGAWRRPLSEADAASLAALVDQTLTDGATLRETLAVAIQAVLMSPRFLFRAEIPPDPSSPSAVPLDGYELATRLSYFLWSTMPDAALLTAAGQGLLDTKEGIATQVQRMLADPRAEALVQNFAGQWLYIRDVDNAIPDPWSFPEFDDALRHAMSEELRLFFRSFVFDGVTGGVMGVSRQPSTRSMIELLTATDTYVNRRLAEHYGIEEHAGVPANDDAWGLVSLEGAPRQGILTKAGLLTALSTPFRTSIVRRGKWVLGQLLCAEPSPPPPGVEGLIEVTEPGAPAKTLREKMEMHKTEERCKTCHKAMDAIGFGLEHYDGIGQWRDTDNGYPIDASSELRGQPFDGGVALSDIIANDARLPACIVDKVMIYALGRGLVGEDEPLLDRIVADFAQRGYRFPALIELVTTSEAFRMREGEAP